MYCRKCDMKIAGERERCPLCNGVLEGEGNQEEEVFPRIHTVYYSHMFFFRLLLAASIAGGLISLVINKAVTGHLTWSLIVLAGIGCMWVSLLLIINKRKNIIRCVLYQVLLISLLVLPWDYFTGWRGWSIDFVLPILYVSLMVAIVVLAKFTKQRLRDQVWYFFFTVLFGLVQIYFLMAGKLTYTLPSYLCASVSILSLALILSFNGADMLAEIRRRTHI